MTGFDFRMIHVTKNITIPPEELQFKFTRSSGPGGQNVNKVASAVQLRYDVERSTALPEDVKQRLIQLAGNQISEDGELIIHAKRYRSQHRNREDAKQRLIELIRKAAYKPKNRRRTKPTQASKKRRLEKKRRHGEKKRLRKPIKSSDI